MYPAGAKANKKKKRAMFVLRGRLIVSNGSLQTKRRKPRLFVPVTRALMGTTTAGTYRAQLRKQLNSSEYYYEESTRSCAYSRFPRHSISLSRVQKMVSLDAQVATKHVSGCPD